MMALWISEFEKASPWRGYTEQSDSSRWPDLLERVIPRLEHVCSERECAYGSGAYCDIR